MATRWHVYEDNVNWGWYSMLVICGLWSRRRGKRRTWAEYVRTSWVPYAPAGTRGFPIGLPLRSMLMICPLIQYAGVSSRCIPIGCWWTRVNVVWPATLGRSPARLYTSASTASSLKISRDLYGIKSNMRTYHGMHSAVITRRWPLDRVQTHAAGRTPEILCIFSTLWSYDLDFFDLILNG